MIPSKEIKYLEKINEEFFKEKGEFNLKEKEEADFKITNIESNIDILSGSRKYLETRKKLVKNIQNDLSELESMFYYKNFKLGDDESTIFSSIHSFLDTCNAYFIGEKPFSSIVNNNYIESVKLDILQLRYIIKYKMFEKQINNILDLESIFTEMKKNRCIIEDYRYENFKKEFEKLIRYNEVFKNFTIKRFFPGETFGYLSKFINLKYDYELIKYFGRYNYLYVFGSEQHQVYKIGVTFNNLTSRFIKAEELFQYRYKGKVLNKIQVIKNPNAYRLELYLKNKFKNYKHPYFNSNEWFKFADEEINYFKHLGYLSDSKFQEICNFDIYI
ncbi:GIY-YIG nuclease family protein [Pseudalkalibacillus salsuginis]|uniref:GIY-YIG nuclease family protein n=1 Tax=Pseudalkalibacillus salsuginis TaxID=2910972 RepID=UPI001F3DA4F2|nr:GIY-YIG nuclease family protein [Pseudalkalibacillus salsuginis]MCF6411503.1 GIY-YIG nuclease family protein [Pseudalkalibacillus salsuginis]